MLIVEDRTEEVELLLVALERASLGVEVQYVPDGEEALAYLRGLNQYADRTKYPLPALLLLDIKLPRRSGFEVLDWVKHKSHLSQLPIIVFSSSRDPNDIETAYALGANAYVCKPSEFQTLVELLKSVSSFWLDFTVPPWLASRG